MTYQPKASETGKGETMGKILIQAKIYAGEGEQLRAEWEGTTTVRGLRKRLKHIRKDGRNAFAIVAPYNSVSGKAGIDFETGTSRDW
jgi:hypothetical protein